MGPYYSDESLLALINRPAFFVESDRVIQVNEAAKIRLIREGDPLSQFVPQIPEAYRELHNGCLFLNLKLHNQSCPACVTRQEAGYLFVLDIHTDKTSQSLALAAVQLRQNLNTVYAALEDIPDHLRSAHMDQALAQMHRLLCNMSDLSRYSDPGSARMAATNLTSVFTETMERGQTLLADAGYQLRYEAGETIISMADRELVERALWNMLSNAVKFSPARGQVEATMCRNGNLLRFTIRDAGDGIKPEIMQHVYDRYLREPAFEDSRHGMGLGLAIVSAIAGLHNGTVLIDQPCSGGTRVTMTMTIKPCPDHTLRSPVVSILGDYCGGFDHGLLELSDVLPAKLYKN